MPEVLTHTKRRDFQNCPRYYWHRHEQLLTLRYQKPGRRRGTAFGDAIFAIEQASGEAPADVAWEAIEQVYVDVRPDNSEEQAEIEVEMIKVAVMAEAYVKRYGLKLGTRERRELQFDLPLINPTTGRHSRAFRRGGKIDGLITLPGHRAVVVEDKFVGSIQKAMIDRLPLDAQISEYVDALLSRGWQAEVYYRHTLVPGTNPVLVGTKATGGRRRETLEEYEARLREDVASRTDHYFNEQRLRFPSDHLDDYRAGRWEVAQEILRKRDLARRRIDKTKMLLYPMNPSRCWEFGGCEFIPLCTKREGAEALYVVTTDNPELRRDDDGATSEYAGA